MTGDAHDLSREYRSALRCYLAGEGEAALQSAYELGRKAIAEGLGGLDMLAIHQVCLAAVLRHARSHQQMTRLVDQAAIFLTECMSPFEMELRGFRDANARLNRNLAELQSAEEKLKTQHTELLAAYEELETERRRYRNLFDDAPDGYLVTDLQGQIEEANHAAERLLGRPSGALAGTSLLQFVVKEMRQEFCTRLQQMLDTGTELAQGWLFDIDPRGADRFAATLSVRVVRAASRRVVGLRWLVRDVSDFKRIEEERAELRVREQVARAHADAAQRFAFLAEVGNLLAASLDCDTNLGAVARRIVPYLADCCLVYLVGPDGKIRLLSSADVDRFRAEVLERESGKPAPLSPESLYATVLREGRARVITEAPEKSQDLREPVAETPRFLFEHDLKSLMLIPMAAQGSALGLLLLGAAEKYRYDDDHLALAEDLARRCALAVDNARLYRAMIAERDKAAEANRAKDDFLGILGHELRNPLVPVLGWARNLRNDPAVAGNPVLSRGVETLERNARNILRLADDCLDLVRISERRITLNQERLDLNQIVQGSIETLRLTAREKGVRFTSQLLPSSLWILGDRTRLEQVLNNLLINAIKYTDPGGLLSVRSLRVDGHAEVQVEDTGIGIAQEFLEQIFQPFSVGSKWLTSDAGLGLGLAIARKIVEMHGGTIWAESPGVRRGSTFHLRFGLAPAGVSAPAPALPASPRNAPAGSVRILLVDDQPDIAELMKADLEALGYKVLTATDGQEGLAIAFQEVPEIIISDLKMPRMDGYELIQSVRGDPRLASVPVIALTGLGMKKHVATAIKAGYNAHVSKPVEINELAAVIERLVAQGRAKASQT